MTTEDAAEFRLPDLRFVPVDALVLHEQHDEQRAGPLVQRLREQGILRNPPVVAPLPDDGRFVVLDGANRATAARTAGLPHLFVQVVRYEAPFVRLTTWHHALAAFPAADLHAALGGLADLDCRMTDVRHARAVLARREAIAFVAEGGDRACTLHGPEDLHRRNALLNTVVDAYRSRARFYRVPQDSLDEAQSRHRDVTALVVFPHFEPAEVIELATSGARLPAGITRHLIRWRALRVNVPLERLADAGTPIAEKNRWLEGWLNEKLNQRQVRFYEESTVLFDE
ncbi:MAG: ParB N-terminal domain-containing protein [Candidatus Eisenbacteria bacterium]|nr:ParB N-terminal domain-containing protein [Candidatus Eisenbacteria bacterium]